VDTGKKILSSIIVKAQKVGRGLRTRRWPDRTFVMLTRWGNMLPSTLMHLFGSQNPKRFEEVFEEMISFLEHTEHWENTEVELAIRGVRVLSYQLYTMTQIGTVHNRSICFTSSPGQALEFL